MEQSRCKYWIRSTRSLTKVTQRAPRFKCTGWAGNGEAWDASRWRRGFDHPQRTDIPERASCPKNAIRAVRRSGLQVELRDVQTALATLREASGNGPRNDLGIIAGEAFERRQCAHGLTCAYQVHLCNNGRFDRHFHGSRTAEGINSTAARGISGMRLRSRKRRFFAGQLHCSHMSVRRHLLPQLAHQHAGALLDRRRRIQRKILPVASRDQLHADRSTLVQRDGDDCAG